MNLSFSDEQNDSYENRNDDPNYAIDSMMLTKYERQKHFFCFLFFLDKIWANLSLMHSCQWAENTEEFRK